MEDPVPDGTNEGRTVEPDKRGGGRSRHHREKSTIYRQERQGPGYHRPRHRDKSWANKLELKRKLFSMKLANRGAVQEHNEGMTEVLDELSSHMCNDKHLFRKFRAL